jgi:NAD(P)-dependent dehydrogenase (short-subunit alcohol dehydrogenase family)
MGESALIVGTGEGLSASLARLYAAEGMQVAIAARNPDKLSALADQVGGHAFHCDATEPSQVAKLFADTTAAIGAPDIVVYNASGRVRGPITDLDAIAVRNATLATCYGGFLVAQQAALQMSARGSGSIQLTGASASVKGYANSSCFAMGKFGLRGLAQALARELQPNNIHVAHFVIDGGIEKPSGDSRATARGEDGMLHPDEIAKSYLAIHRQHRSAWTWEIELRPWKENF